jgi:2-keto-3-deoxy-L-rhamnonate aldolase RhmA
MSWRRQPRVVSGALSDTSTRSFADYYRKAQDERIARIAILESREAVRNTEAIMSMNGVTRVLIGKKMISACSRDCWG